MDDNARTLFCGNLSDKVTEDILYELFLQGGPVQKISIPKDRDGKQRTYAFVTYKHTQSVDYALNLFKDTMLYNRALSMKLRNSTESPQAEKSLELQKKENMNSLESIFPMGYFGLQQLVLADTPYPIMTDGMKCNGVYSNQSNSNSGKNDRNFQRMHPYQRDRDRNRERDRIRERDRDRERDRERNRERNHDYHRDERHNRDNNYRFNEYSRYNGNRKRWTYH